MEWLKSILAGLFSASAVVAVVAFLGRGWIDSLFERRLEKFKHELGLDAKTRELTLSSQIEFKERQLSEFYGPIYALLKRGRPIYDLWGKGRLHEVEADITSLFLEANNRIVEIILSKSHLIHGDQIPDSFTQFLTHVAVWHSYLKTPHRGVPFSKEEFPEAYYPDDFEREIFQVTELLKRELDELYRQYGLIDVPDKRLLLESDVEARSNKSLKPTAR